MGCWAQFWARSRGEAWAYWKRAQHRPSEVLQGLKQLCRDEGLRAGAAQPGAEEGVLSVSINT